MGKMKPIFTPADFETKDLYGSPGDKALFCADVANKNLASYLESCPVVYRDINEEIWGLSKQSDSPAKARLICIEMLNEKPCEHEPTSLQQLGHYDAHCKKCGIELVARWEAK